MNEDFRKAAIYAMVGGLVTAIPVSGANFCGPRDVCGLKAEEMWHVEQPAPAPTQTVPQISVAVSTAASGGTFYSVMR
jgi:hypothetical protein